MHPLFEKVSAHFPRFSAPELPPGADAPDVTRILQSTLTAAAEEEASDVHFEPKEDCLLVRFRIDGAMLEHARLPLAQREPLLARIKIFGSMDITEKRLPQDGRARLNEDGKNIHLRISSLPTVHGESLVVRLLDQAMPVKEFPGLGLTAEQSVALHDALHGPAGLIFLTGPTGSGKTTTLHAALHALDFRGRVICTLEDPVEYELAVIRQTEIREKIGLTFASSLRSLLRQNPDVILVGETRDTETAQLAVRAALTGHLVLSTLHTNNALAAIPRLLDLGVEPFLLAASLRLVAAQRLVRRLCPQCKQPHPENARLAEKYHLPDARFARASDTGCPACKQRGYRGRIGLHEVIPAAPYLPLVAASAPMAEFEKLHAQSGVLTLWQHGLSAAAAGHTSVEEILRVL
ncbi:type II secretion system protein E [Opitutaceae bacterium TAV5]|nr:type II secretion system protein E [Opitutaceae bacterium TAV5]